MAASSYHFRTALSGYNKGDVTAYIEKIAAKHRFELLERERLIVELQEEIHSLNQQLNLMMMAVPSAAAAPAEEEKPQPVAEPAIETGEELAAPVEEAPAKEAPAEAEPAVEPEPEAPVAAEEPEPEPEEETAAPKLPTGTEDGSAYLVELVSLELQAYRRAEAAERKANNRARNVYRELESLCDSALESFRAAGDALKQPAREGSDNSGDFDKAYEAFAAALNASREKIAAIDKLYPSAGKK
ncbi:MAG: hypothetical protein IKZ19_04540 [Clostridia bacterium]|nr:hypothetical protein [Clostridia bacterium]